MKKLVIESSELLVSRIRAYFEHSNESKFIHRLDCVLLYLLCPNETFDSIAAKFGHSPRSVSSWVKKLQSTSNVESLRSIKQPGRPSRLSAQQKYHLKNVLQHDPKDYQLTSNIWDGKTVSYYIQTVMGVELHVRACQELLHELGFSLKRARCNR